MMMCIDYPLLLRIGRQNHSQRFIAFYAVPRIFITLTGESGFPCCEKTPERGAGEKAQPVQHAV